MDTNSWHFRKTDLIAIAIVLVLAAAVLLAFLPSSDDSPAQVAIYKDGDLIKTLSINTPQIFEISGKYTNTVTIQDGKVSITQSNCPGGDCVACGWAASSGRSIVCLPNGVEIRILSQDSDVDFVVG